MTTPYEQFAEAMLQKDSKVIPEIIRCMTTPDQAELLVTMPGTAVDLAGRLGRPETDVAADLNDMFRKGLAFKKVKDGDTLWRAPVHIIQFHDATLVWPEAPPELYELWRKYMEEEWPALAPGLSSLLPRPFTRVIPVNRSLGEARAQVLAPDSVQRVIDSASRLAVTPCTCRLSMKKCDAPIEMCIQVGRGADYTIERGSGREISKEEATDILTRAGEQGLVHVTMNKTGAGHFICNCCGCCCQSFSLLRADNVALCDPSRFRPLVDADACTGCGTCEERCWFDAIAVDGDVADVNAERCLGCGQCALGCPDSAIAMEAVRAPEFIPD